MPLIFSDFHWSFFANNTKLTALHNNDTEAYKIIPAEIKLLPVDIEPGTSCALSSHLPD